MIRGLEREWKDGLSAMASDRTRAAVLRGIADNKASTRSHGRCVRIESVRHGFTRILDQMGEETARSVCAIYCSATRNFSKPFVGGLGRPATARRTADDFSRLARQRQLRLDDRSRKGGQHSETGGLSATPAFKSPRVASISATSDCIDEWVPSSAGFGARALAD